MRIRLNATMVVTILLTALASQADNVTLHVRGDGSGNDTTHGGSAWNDAYATLQKALDTVPYNTQTVINVQASTGTQFYAVCSRTTATFGNGFNIAFQGGWEGVDGATPVQTGMSAVKDSTTNAPGIQLVAGSGFQPLTLGVNRFAISAVTTGIVISTPASDGDFINLTVSNTSVRAKNDGLYIRNQYNLTLAYAQAKVTLENVDIVAGLGGAGHGVYASGPWVGSAVRATTGSVSSITSSNGCGVYFTSVYLSPASSLAHAHG